MFHRTPQVPSISVHELKALLDASGGVGGAEQGADRGAVALIDVREPGEYSQGHVPGARSVPLQTVPQLLDDLPQGPIYLICAVGQRSAYAAQFLGQQGVEACNVEGGTRDWVAAGYPVSS
jgi:rhodanese-related sulfurtransferase